jgi:small subunit ribosomal protein S11e
LSDLVKILPLRPLLLAHSSAKPAIMATELTVQSERAYQQQPHIFLNHKVKAAKSRKVGKGGRRWYKDVGLGFRTPKTAIEGSYIGQ